MLLVKLISSEDGSVCYCLTVAIGILVGKCGTEILARDDWECLRPSMELCNELQGTGKGALACFTVDDMRLLSRAAQSLDEAVWILLLYDVCLYSFRSKGL